MPLGTKRKRHNLNGLSAGELLRRDRLAGPERHARWGWVSNVVDPSKINAEHRRIACGFYDKAGNPICKNKYRDFAATKTVDHMDLTDNDRTEDIIIISSGEEETYTCSKKRCKDNPQCLNYIGQMALEKRNSLQSFIETRNLGPNPLDDARKANFPVGLKNLGATCYANAFIQVWYQDQAFREGVYRCKPSQSDSQDLENSPIFQLQFTFAALQEGTQNIFNPVKLVESLRIPASEQQDAQEFSKLFMSHLSAEFEKQEVPSLKTLITDQFEGKQTYGTKCQNCGYYSENDTSFLELEVNLESNENLEECIGSFLRPEELSDDNKYYCVRCDGLQNATRYIKLRKLPPVLHISVLRFAFDLASLSRKKSKQSIIFPTVLDMHPFMDIHDLEGCDPGAAAKGAQPPDLKYEIRGVLLHKGPSAYHGHYEAQVYDSATKQFYQFNDEVVTPIASLQSRGTKGKKGPHDAMPPAANNKGKTYSRKKSRITESDGESVNNEDQSYISSKDAYMLVYALRDGSCMDVSDRVPEPPVDARERVAKLNAAYNQECKLYMERENSWTNVFERMRRTKKSIYDHWEISDHREESAVVSHEALMAWIMKDIEQSKDENVNKTRSIHHFDVDSFDLSDQHFSQGSPSDPLPPQLPTPAPVTNRLDNSGIVCHHGSLDPRKTREMKRIKQQAVTAIRRETDSFFEPELTTADVCNYCTEELFLERRYELDHPNHLSQFDELCELESEYQGAWISKRWLADWRQPKPKMHIFGMGDPSPGDPEYDAHVRCAHGQLSLESTSRKRLNGEACAFLQDLFPSWVPFPEGVLECETCREELLLHKEIHLDRKKKAESEKTRLRHLFSTTIFDVGLRMVPGVDQAILSTDFLRQWRAWLQHPQGKPRPGPIDNSRFICEHDRLIIDPNVPKDLDASVSFVSLPDWGKLQELYGGGPLISFMGPTSNKPQVGISDPNIEVCYPCRKERLNNFESAAITIRILRDKEPDPTPADWGDESLNVEEVSPWNDLDADRDRRMPNRRRSSRRTGRTRKMQINKAMTVKDIKIKLHEALDIPTICQRLFFKGVELADNSETVASLGVVPNDTLFLRGETERDEGSDSETELESILHQQQKEGPAFGGTVLSGFPRKAGTPISDDDEEEEETRSTAKAKCPACTFVNPEGLAECSICSSPLPQV